MLVRQKIIRETVRKTAFRLVTCCRYVSLRPSMASGQRPASTNSQ